MRWMNLEPIMQSEVSQKEKDKYCILMHIYRIYKNGTEEFIYRAAMEKHREQTYGHGEMEVEGEMYGKSNMETYVTICKIDSQQEFAVWYLETHTYFHPRLPFIYQICISVKLFHKFFKLIFYQGIIALQNFVVFCQTSTWISHRYTSIPYLLNLTPISCPILPLQIDTEPLFEFPEAGLFLFSC